MDNYSYPLDTTQYEHKLNRATNWFFVIAGLSLLNTVILMSGSTVNFIVGLGLTTLAGAIGSKLGMLGKSVIFIFNTFAAGIFVLLGLLGRKHHKWAVIVGMVLYGLDGLIFLLVQDFLGVAFHGYALFGLYQALPALTAIAQAKQQQQPVTQTPYNPNNPGGGY